MTNHDDIKLEDLPEEYRDVAEAIGLKAALKLVNSHQGCQLYVPKLETITRQRKYRQMYEDFQAYSNFKRVAIKHGLSESRTRQIIKDEKRRRFPRKHIELSLF